MSHKKTPKIFIFVALECEARSLIKYYGLKKQSGRYHFSLYANEQILLTVTGVGKVAMAGAVAYTLALFPVQEEPLIVNIGIAGHKTADLGQLLLAVKIIDNESNKTFYPQLLGEGWPESCSVLTASLPCLDYKQSYAHDMEASAFYETAIRFSSSELIHSIKIVSDNEFSNIDNINAKGVVEWVANKITEIDILLMRWASFGDSIGDRLIDEYDEIAKKWRFTVSGENKLKTLLLRWVVLSNRSWLATINDAQFRNGKDALKRLEKDTDNLEVYL